MGGRGGSSGQSARRERGRGQSDGMGGGTQTAHNPWKDAIDIHKQLGVGAVEALDLYDSVNGGSGGGFTRGWDTVIRDYQNGMPESKIIAKNRLHIESDWRGDEKAYMDEVKKKAANVEKLIDKAPKWAGGELQRGYHDLPQDVMASLTKQGELINLNYGTASWTTNPAKAIQFSHANYNPSEALIAHCSASKRRGTSIKNLSHFKSEDEVLCSKQEAFVCTKVQVIGGVTHAWYDLVKTNKKW